MSQKLIELRKKELSEIFLSEGFNPERLSYNSIQKYLHGINSPSLISWRYLRSKLGQNGLMKFFDEIGLKFYVQDNKKNIDEVIKSILLAAKLFHEKNSRTPNWSELEILGFKSEVEYLRQNMWGKKWTILELNELYVQNNLPKIDGTKNTSIDRVLNWGETEIKNELGNLYKRFNKFPNITTLRNLQDFDDLNRYIRSKSRFYKKNEGEFYFEILNRFYGPDFYKMTDVLISLSGLYCDSYYEVIFDNICYHNNIKSKSHLRYNDIFEIKSDLISDKIIDGVIFEIVGYNQTHTKYHEKIRKKKQICDNNNVKIVFVEAFKFNETQFDSYIDYVVELLINENISIHKKPSVMMALAGKSVMDDIRHILIEANKMTNLSIKNLKSVLGDKFKVYRHCFGGTLHKFISFIDNKEYLKYSHLRDLILTTENKKFKRYKITTTEKIKKGLEGLSKYILQNNLKELPTSIDIEKNKHYRFINDYFRTENIWTNIGQKGNYYYELCNLLGFEIVINRIVHRWYDNHNNIIDILDYISKTYGRWVPIRKINGDKQVRKLWSFICQQIKSVKKFREIYKEDLLKYNLYE
jgi:hypothetical protein